MRTVPRPLNWKILSSALKAPPPLTYEVPEDCLKVAASSQTSAHQTLFSVLCAC
jgi:hypothetical protein